MVLSILIFLLFYLTSVSTEPVRLCIPQKNLKACLSMSQEMPNFVQCVSGRDKLDCMYIILNRQADLVNVAPEEVYIGGRYFSLVPVAMEATAYEKSYTYRAAAVVRKDLELRNLADLRNKSSCHGTFSDVVGWHVPISVLMGTDVIAQNCKNELHAIGSFFLESCVAGSWSTDPVLEEKLRQKYPQLCSGCGNGTSCLNNSFAGHEGALRCLINGGSDIAFTTIEATQTFFENRRTQEAKYEFLCLNTTRESLKNPRPCYWAQLPSNAFIGLPQQDSNKNRLVRILQQMFTRYTLLGRPSWGHLAFVSSENVTNVVPVLPTTNTWNDYLGSSYLSTIEKHLPACERNVVRFCVNSLAAYKKCKDFEKAAYAWRLRPEIRCINKMSELECIETVKSNHADVVILESSNVYHAGRYYGFQPIIGERYNESDISSWAVAVVRRDSNIKRLRELKGRRSCHNRVMDISGWIAPVSRLMDAGLVVSETCDIPSAVANFFSSSCVPGIADSSLNVSITDIDKFCHLCVGSDNGSHVCSPDKKERYYGNEGAFKCLTDRKGDVAFLDCNLFDNFSKDNVNSIWTNQLQEDFRLLCSYGGQGRIADYQACHIAAIPAKYVMMSNYVSENDKMNAIRLLVTAGHVFGPQSSSFRLFGLYQHTPDLIFSDTTTSLKAIPSQASYRDVLGEEFIHMIEMTDHKLCEYSSGVASKRTLSFALVMLCSLILKLKL
ncbi:transferrin-like [Tachypleus tridentatus]|uniref:transferrin-like n=1 Tax=Tachypleus tridentatus TaxID=6853 RepID=UPI003FD6B88E